MSIIVSNGGSTTESNVRLQITLDAALLSGDVIEVLRSGQVLAGLPTQNSSLSYQFIDAPGVGQHAYAVRVTRGQSRSLSAAYNITLAAVPPPPPAPFTYSSTIKQTCGFDQFFNPLFRLKLQMSALDPAGTYQVFDGDGIALAPNGFNNPVVHLANGNYSYSVLLPYSSNFVGQIWRMYHLEENAVVSQFVVTQCFGG